MMNNTGGWMGGGMGGWGGGGMGWRRDGALDGDRRTGGGPAGRPD